MSVGATRARPVDNVSQYTMPKATGARCSCCQNPNRAAIDDVLYLRSAGELLPNGIRPDLDWFLANCEGLWGLKTSRAAVARHVARHIHFTGPGRRDKPVVSREADALAVREKVSDADAQDAQGTERFLRKLISAAEAKVDVAPESVSLELAVKAAGELRQRQLDDHKGLLMGALVQAMSGPGISEERKREIDAQSEAATAQMFPHDVIEAEVVEVESDVRLPVAVKVSGS